MTSHPGEIFMTRGARYSIIFLFALTLAAAGLNLLFTAHQVAASNHKWCTTLNLLTAHPVPKPAAPSANPSRENAYILYADFADLRHQLGCG